MSNKFLLYLLTYFLMEKVVHKYYMIALTNQILQKKVHTM